MAGQNFRCETSGEDGTSANKIPDVRHPEKMGLWSDRIPDVRHPEKVGLWPDRIPDVRHPEKVGCACKRIEIKVMQSEDMCMDINTMGRPPVDVPPRLADKYAW